MPAAQTKADLLAVTKKEWDKLTPLLEDFDDAAAQKPDDTGTSALRIAGHRAAWIDLYFDWCDAAARGEVPDMPAPGYKWNQLPALNAAIFERQKHHSWDEMRARLAAAHDSLLADIEGASEEDLYGAPLAPTLKWTRGRYAEASGASHYRSAAKVLRQLKRAAA
ncbi:MAG: ClbS/DfsB family four-helix bundle protein [Pseudomonadota bacterium]